MVYLIPIMTIVKYLKDECHQNDDNSQQLFGFSKYVDLKIVYRSKVLLSDLLHNEQIIFIYQKRLQHNDRN